MLQQTLASIDNAFPLKKLDAGEFSAFRAGPLSVKLDWYDAAGLGNVSFLQGKAMAGLMRMETLVIQATGRDMPLFSSDYIGAMGNYTLLVEYYDTLLKKENFNPVPFDQVKASGSGIPDHDLGKHWYDGMKLSPSISKKARKLFVPEMNRLVTDALAAYLNLAKALPALEESQSGEKRGLAADYVNGLLERGGPSTDAFLKALGKEKTRTLFTGIVFGTERA